MARKTQHSGVRRETKDYQSLAALGPFPSSDPNNLPLAQVHAERGQPGEGVTEIDVFIRGPEANGFYHFSDQGPADALLVKDTGGGFARLATAAGGDPIRVYQADGTWIMIMEAL